MTPKPGVAFAFDIDGVLVRSKDPLPGVSTTIKYLQKHKIPFIFLTNGGGSTEDKHVALLGKRLGISTLSEHQFIQSHTPFRDLVPSLKDKNILVLGGTGNSIRNVALAYGFRNVLTPSDIIKAYPDIYPFAELTREHHEEHGACVLKYHNDEKALQISAILVWSSPRDWGFDLQIVTDLLLSSKGVIGTVSSLNGDKSLPNNGYLQDSQPQIHFCNPDLAWATSYKHPRVAQGAFKAALEGVWNAFTGGADITPKVKMCGKPTEKTYVYGEKALINWSKMLNEVNAEEIKEVIMVGDNPLSDIQGAKGYQSRFGAEWKSVLVESGVFTAGDVPPFQPSTIQKGVKEAVEWGLCVQIPDENSEKQEMESLDRGVKVEVKEMKEEASSPKKWACIVS